MARPYPARSLLAIALENATEGCVFELYSAALAHHQAQSAGDIDIRRALLGIAEEEVGHAAWSLRLHAWLMSQLAAPEQEQVRCARQRALAQLKLDVQRRPCPAPCHRHLPEQSLGGGPPWRSRWRAPEYSDPPMTHP